MSLNDLSRVLHRGAQVIEESLRAKAVAWWLRRSLRGLALRDTLASGERSCGLCGLPITAVHHVSAASDELVHARCRFAAERLDRERRRQRG